LQSNIQRVKKFFLLFIVALFLASALSAQVTVDSDSVKTDTPVLKKETIRKDSAAKKIIQKKDTVNIIRDSSVKAKIDTIIGVKNKRSLIFPSEIILFKSTLKENPYFNFYGKIKVQDIQVHRASSTDGLFYLILGLCFYFAFIRLLFWKYINNLFSLFFRASMRQQQIREQALQTPLPSLLLNILFVFSLGLYLCFLVRYYQFAQQTDFWILYAYCAVAMLAVYVSKFGILKICGWVFNITKASDNYIFIVFLINKIMGIGLLPFLTIIAFSNHLVVDIAITLSLAMIVILFIYRFIACFGTLRSEIKLNVFHYFLYLCAFEIAPLLLIYKVVLSFLEKAY